MITKNSSQDQFSLLVFTILLTNDDEIVLKYVENFSLIFQKIKQVF